jgi:hypothetical protein
MSDQKARHNPRPSAGTLTDRCESARRRPAGTILRRVVRRARHEAVCSSAFGGSARSARAKTRRHNRASFLATSRRNAQPKGVALCRPHDRGITGRTSRLSYASA